MSALNSELFLSVRRRPLKHVNKLQNITKDANFPKSHCKVLMIWQNQGQPPDSNVEHVLIGTKIFMTHAVNSKASWEQRQPNTFVLMYQHHTCHCLWYDLAMKATQLDWLAWEHCICRENKFRVNRLLWITSIQICHTVAG